MIYIDKKVRSDREALEFVRACEADFDNRLSATIQSVIRDKNIRCITLSGPTCAGKTTAAHKLINEIESSGRLAKIISIDDFFYGSGEVDVLDKSIDYDSIAAIDLDYFGVCVKDLMEGRRTMLPHYDFKARMRSGLTEHILRKNEVLIFEGIQAVYPEVTCLLEEYAYKSIFVNVIDDVSVSGVAFSPNDIRLSRRIVRDSKFRAASPEFTLYVWDNVRRNEEHNIFPYVSDDTYFLDSFQPYELFMIGQYVIPLLETVPKGSPCFAAARDLHQRFCAIRGCEISPSCLSVDSLYHEFLG